MCCKVFKFIRHTDNTFVYLNGDDVCSPDTILKLYVDWYNTDFCITEDCSEISINDFTYVESFCPIDFYDESRKLCRFNYV